MAEMSDAQLVQRIRAGQTPWFRELVDRYQAAVFAVAVSRLGRREDALDVTQEALLQAYRGLDQLHEPDKLGPWLCGIARRLAVAHHRRAAVDRAARQKRETEHTMSDAGLPDPLEAMNRAELRLAIRRAVLKLPPDQREVVALFYLSGWPQPRIAEFLARPLGTIKRLLHEARRHLHKELLAMGLDDAQSCNPGPDFTDRVLNAVTQVRVKPDGDGAQVFLTDERGRSMLMLVSAGSGQAMAPHARGGTPPADTDDAYHAMLVALRQLDWTLRELEVTELKLHTFHGRLRLSNGRRELDIDCRPSDGLNLALRAHAPVFIADVLAEHHHLRDLEGQPLAPQQLDDPEFGLPGGALFMMDPPFADLWQVVEAVKRDPENARARHSLLSCAPDFRFRPAKVSDVSAGMAPLEQWVESAQGHAERALALSLLGAVRLWAMKDAAAAVEPLAEAMRLAPDDGGIRLDLATAYARLGRADEALELFNQPFHVMNEDAAHVARHTGNLADIWDHPRFEQVIGPPNPDARLTELNAVMRMPIHRRPPDDPEAARRNERARRRLRLSGPPTIDDEGLRAELARPEQVDLPAQFKAADLHRATRLRWNHGQSGAAPSLMLDLEQDESLTVPVAEWEADIVAGAFSAGRPARPQTATLFVTIFNAIGWPVHAAVLRTSDGELGKAELLLRHDDRIEQATFPAATAAAIAAVAQVPLPVDLQARS